MREFIDKKKKKLNEFYGVKHKAKKHDFHLEEEILVKDKQDREYIPNAFQIINIKGSSIEPKGNRDGKVVFWDPSHFKKFIIKEITQWSVLRYKTQKVAQQQQIKLHQCQM